MNMFSQCSELKRDSNTGVFLQEAAREVLLKKDIFAQKNEVFP